MAAVRVLWVIKGLGPGGAEMLLRSLATVRDRERVHYEVAFLLPWKDHLVERLADADVPAHCLSVRGGGDLRWVPRLRDLVRRRDIDVVHFHSPLVAGIGRPAVRLMRRTPAPAVGTTEHNVWWSYALPTRAVNAATAFMDSFRFAVSEEVRATVARPWRGCTETLVHGLLLDDVEAARGRRAEIRQEMGITDGQVMVCTVANFRAQKGYPDLLRAARSVVDTNPDVRFVVVGQGPEEPAIRRDHARLGLQDHMVLTGYREDALAVLAASDLFVLASLHEGFPVAVMEALAVGVPVIATRVGGIPDAVGHGREGLLVPPGHPDRLADAVLALARDEPRRRDMAAAARAAGTRFDIRQAEQRMEEVYQRVAARRTPARRATTGG